MNAKHTPAKNIPSNKASGSSARNSDKKKARSSGKPLNLFLGFFILVYVLGVTFTPNMLALDTNATKFLALSLINILAFIALSSSKQFRSRPGLFGVFLSSKAGLLFGGFLLANLLSFVNAIEVLESVIQFAKVSTIFSAALIFTAILTSDMRFVRFVILVGFGMLIFDSLTVFYFIGKFIAGEIDSIFEIKSVYSNKNILASAVFVKIPFALWLLVFEKGWIKKLAVFALLISFMATFFLVTRGFYIGLIAISIAFIVYSVVQFNREKNISRIKTLAAYIGALVIAVAAFTFTQRNLYSVREGRDAQGVVEQIASIRGDASTSTRVDAWTWSFKILKDNPILGTGAGNWKIAILEHENQVKNGYIYLYKAHNDFIEIAAETGILGGLMYIGMYLLVFWWFFRLFLRRDGQNHPHYPLFFLAAFGLFFYSFDAMFNFPADRPEIFLMFAIFLAIGIAASVHGKLYSVGEAQTPIRSFTDKPLYRVLFQGVMILLMAFGSYALHQNLKSIQLQRLVFTDIASGSLSHTSDTFIGKFPGMPRISIWGESIASLKARYLINEKKFQEAVDILRNDHSNPFDGRREYFMAMAFFNMEMPDSALYYSKQVYQVKPYYFQNLSMMLVLLERLEQDVPIIPYLERFLATETENPQAWLFAASYFEKENKLERAFEIIKEAKLHLPEDSLIVRQHGYLDYRINIEPHIEIYNMAIMHYQNSNHREAIRYFTQYMELTPENPDVYRMRAFSYYFTNAYEAAISDINRYLQFVPANYSLINLRGVCNQSLGNLEAACVDFELAMRNGNDSGKTNFERFCQGINEP